MGYRKEALESQAFQELRHAYENPDEVLLEYRAKGEKLVWMRGIDVPEEIIIAAGMVPARVVGTRNAAMPYGDKFVGESFGPVWRAQFDKIVALAEAGKMECLAFGNTDDMDFKMFNYIREMKRLNYGRYLPEVCFVDLELLHRDYFAQERNNRIIEKFIKSVERWCWPKKIEKADLARGIAVCNKHRGSLRAFDVLRSAKECRITGSEALAVIGGAMIIEKERATELVLQVTQDMAAWPVVEKTPAYFTGSMQEYIDVYEMIENAGGNVVFEDIETGTRYFDQDIDETINPIFAIAQRYTKRMPSGERGFVAERAALAEKVCKEKNIQAFVVYMNRKDEAFVWDYPDQKKVLEPLGVRTFFTERQDYPIREKETLQKSLNDFFMVEEEK